MVRKISMKICQICSVDFTVKKFLIPLIDDLEASNHEVTIVCSKGEYFEELKSKYKLHIIKINRNFNILSHLISMCKLIFFFKKNKFDVVHVHTPIASIIARIAARIAGIKLIVYTAHGYYFHENMNKYYKKLHIFIEFLLGKITDLIFLQSYEDYLDTIKFKINTKRNSYFIGNGVNKEIFDPNLYLRRDYDKDNKFYVGFLGRFCKEKGILEFIKSSGENN
jgi:hypothetical protein